MANLATVRSLPLHAPPRDANASDPGLRPARRPYRLGLLAPIALFLAAALSSFLLPGGAATDQSLTDRLLPPVTNGGDWDHLLGTDGLGRDVLARIALGARQSLQIALLASVPAAVLGTSAGILAGLRGGWFDRALTTITEVTLTVPSVVVAVVLTATLGQSTRNLIVILVLNSWIAYARIVRLQARQVAHADYILAAAALGAPTAHVAWRHFTPNLLPTIFILLFQQLGGMMLWESSLTYLGLGARPDLITLGAIVRDGQEQIFNAWWVSVCSGTALATGIVGFAFLGDWIRARLDHRAQDQAFA